MRQDSEINFFLDNCSMKTSHKPLFDISKQDHSTDRISFLWSNMENSPEIISVTPSNMEHW